MTVFDLAGLSGFELAPIELSDSSDTAGVGVRLTDPLLWMPADQQLQLTASFQNSGGGNLRLTLTGTFTPPESFAGGAILLDSLELVVPFTGVSTPTLDITATRPVTATGAARWVLPSLAAQLGVGAIGFSLGFDSSSVGAGLTLSLAAPVAIPNAFLEVTDARAAVTVYPTDQTFEIALAGSGGLTTAGRAKATALLEPIVGPGNHLDGVPGSFAFRRRFHLAAGKLPAVALPSGPALMSLVPDWSNGQAPALALPAPTGLDLDIGLVELSLKFDEAGGPPTDFELRFTDCGLHFAQLGALPAFDMAGALAVSQQGFETVLRLQPSLAGNFEFPDFLAFFMSRIRWLADAANLHELAEQLQLSMGELEWEQLFRGLLTPAGNLPGSFAALFEGLLGQAIDVLGSTTSLERIFMIAFSAFEDVGTQAYPILWSTLQNLTGGPHLPAPEFGGVVASLLQLLSDSPDMLRAALQSLMSINGLDVGAIIGGLVNIGSQSIDDAATFLRLLMEAIAAALGAIDSGPLATILMDLMVANDDSSTAVSVPSLLGVSRALDSPDFMLPAIPALLMSALSGIIASIPGFVPRLPSSDSLYEMVRDIAGGLGDGLAALGIDQLFDIDQVVKLLEAIIDYSAADLAREKMLLSTSRMPVLGAAVTLVATLKAAITNPLPWWDLMGANVEHDAGYNTARLDAPGTANPDDPTTKRKYLIFSDVHRDKADDDRGFLNFGSIDHFTHNHNLFLRVLDWADDSGYSVIEGGDGEELWYIRDFEGYDGPAAELDAIIAKNQAVYAKLRSLQHRGRYVRIKGNHDSYLDLPSVRARLDATMFELDSKHAFDLYDFAIIPGVKTMQDSLLWDTAGRGLDLVRGTLSVDDFVNETATQAAIQPNQVLGLDSTFYEEKKPLVVAHGHQWDFWNCRGNELVGKMLSNLVGVPADQLLDPFVDARGIAWAGAPVVNFAAIAADLPLFDNWKATRQSVEFAHQIQHQSSADRMLVDDVMFQETLAALTAFLGFEVDQVDDDGVMQTGADLTDPIERFMALRFNQLCLGHTHFPQSQPFWDLEALLAPLGIGDLIRSFTSTFMFGWEPSLNFVRALYYNTGTAGWHEGVIWAIEITELGHARLVFWTHNSIEPETMDWELDEMPEDLRTQLDQRADGISSQVVSFLETVGGGAAGAAMAAAATIASVPMEVVAGVVAQTSGDVDLDLGAMLDGTADAAQSALNGLQALVGEVITTAALRGPGAASSRTFSVRVPVPPGIDAALADVGALLNQVSGIDAALIPKLACGWVQVVRNLPFFGGFESRLDTTATADRVFWVIVSLLFQLPTTQSTSSSLPLAANAAFDGGDLVLTLTVG